MRMGLAVAALVAVSSPEVAEAASIVWNGGTGVWSTGTNWVGGVAPGSADTATFSGSTTACSITSPVSVAAIAISVGVTITQTAGISVTTSGNFTQSAGTFVGASSGTSTISVGGNFSLSNGTFTSTSWRLLVSGGFSITGGTFNHNGGWIDLNSTSSQTFATNGATFNTVYVGGALVANWKMDETSGTTATSSTHYGSNLSYVTAPTQSTSGGPAAIDFHDPAYLTFDGSSTYASASATSTLEFNATQSYTLSAWVKATNTVEYSCQDVVSFGRDTSPYWGLWLSPGSPGPA